MPELHGPILDIGFDGAVTNGGGFASVGDELILSRVMPEEIVVRLEEFFTSRGIHWYLQSYDRLFASTGLPELMQGYLRQDQELHLEKARAAGKSPDELEFFSISAKVFNDSDELDRTAIAKAVLLTDDAVAMESALADLADEFAVVSGTIPVPLGASGEVTMSGVNKGAAILELLEYVGVDPAHAIGIGDNWNDVEMFEVCGLSIAMGNAAPEVQELTDQVTTSLDDDGIHNAFVRNGLV